MSLSRPAAPATPLLGGVPSPILIGIGAAWAAAIAAEASGSAASLHHDTLLEGGPGFGPALLLFLVAWQVMIAAMMLPSSLPLVRMYAAASEGAPQRSRSLAAFLGATRWCGRRSARWRSPATRLCTRASRRARGWRRTTGRSRRRCCCWRAPSSSRH